MGEEHSAAEAGRARSGILSPDGQFYWTGERWLEVVSPDRRWRCDGQAWVAFERFAGAPASTSNGKKWARILPWLLGGWIVTVLLELFVVYDYFVLELTSGSGTPFDLRWGVVSMAVELAIAIVLAIWLASDGKRVVRAISASRRMRWLTAAWAACFVSYVLSDVIRAETVRGVPIDGSETRWQVLLSAAIGIAAAVLAMATVKGITRVRETTTELLHQDSGPTTSALAPDRI